MNKIDKLEYTLRQIYREVNNKVSKETEKDLPECIGFVVELKKVVHGDK